MSTKDRLYDRYTTQQVRFDSRKLSSSRPYLEKVATQLFPRDKNARIVDLGCGFGALLAIVQDLGYVNSSGVDISPEQVTQAEALGVKNVTLGDGFDFLIRLPDQSVDVICAFDILEHLTNEQLFQTGDQISRVLKHGGTCIAHVPNAGGIFGSTIRYSDLTHERAFTEASLSQFAWNIGLSLSRIYEDKPTIHGIRSMVRSLLWIMCTSPFRLLHLAETGTMPKALSRNILCVLNKD